MSDLSALHAAICADPGDDTARLAYADALDEQGTPAAAKRAAYIRVAVERHARETADTPAAALGRFFRDHAARPDTPLDWSACDPEFDRLMRAFADPPGTRPPTPKSESLPTARGYKFERAERGFHAQVNVTDPDVFLVGAPDIFRAAPVSRVHFTKLDEGQARSFVRAGHLARVRHLGFDRVSEAAVRVLGGHPDAAGVASLTLDMNAGTGARLEALQSGSHWTGVESLEFTGAYFGNAYGSGRAVAALLRSENFKRLRHLRAGGIYDDGDTALRAIAGLTELRSLHLSDGDIWEAGTGAIARSARLKNLRYLYYDGNALSDRGAAATALVNAPNLKSLTALHLDVFGGLSAKVLEGPSRGPTLRALSFGNTLTAPVLGALAKCPALQGLWCLEMRYCDLTDSGLRALARGWSLRHLVTLNVQSWNATEKAVAVLLKRPELASLQALKVDTKAIGPAVAKGIVAAPHLAGLRCAYFDANARARAILEKHFGDRWEWW